MSGTYPSTPSFNSVGFTAKNYNLMSESLSGRTQVRNIGGQRFEFKATYPPITSTEFAPVMSFIMKQNGMLETFQIVLPEISVKSGDASGSVQTSATAAIGATSVAVDGLTGTLKAGDVIKFNGHTKVYMITDDLTGSGTLNFSPSLRASVGDNESVIFTNVPFTVRLNNDIQQYTLGLSSLVKYEVDFIEAL